MPSGATFLGSTPECLYTRTGTAVASEAVAGTRARGAGGDVERDFWLAFDLLRSHKDHVEFTVVRDWVQQALGEVCDSVQVDVAKSVLKQGAVQHLYGKLSAQVRAVQRCGGKRGGQAGLAAHELSTAIRSMRALHGLSSRVASPDLTDRPSTPTISSAAITNVSICSNQLSISLLYCFPVSALPSQSLLTFAHLAIHY